MASTRMKLTVARRPRPKPVALQPTKTRLRPVPLEAVPSSKSAGKSTRVGARHARTTASPDGVKKARFAATRADLIHPLFNDKGTYDFDVSVIFGTYNRKEMLIQAVESVRHAVGTLSYQIIVADGGSRDGSREWLREQNDVIALDGDLSGAVNAFNACFKHVRGRYVIAFNDDCEIEVGAIAKAVAYFVDPMVGQVAMKYLEEGKWKIQDVHRQVYANYSITRTYLAREIAKICGGFWATCYRTYGGDTELSCWVYRLGYKVVGANDVRLVDKHARDELRQKNHIEDQERHAFFKRWPSADHMKFRGPVGDLRTGEIQVLQRVEVGEAPEDRWRRIPQLDPRPGELPARAQLRSERVLHMHLWTDEDPQNGLCGAMRKLGSRGHIRIDWTKLSPEQRARDLVEAARSLHPTVVFLQIQGANLAVDAIRQIRREAHDPSLVVCLWNGDVAYGQGPWEGFKDEWHHQASRHADLMLYTGTGQVEILRRRGMKNAAYLQIGYDTDRYFPGDDKNYGERYDIVFLGQNYARTLETVPANDIVLRRQLVSALQSSSLRAGVFGNGWPKAGHLHQSQVGDLYRHVSLATTVSMTSQLARYSSDRLTRSMACGTPTLVKRFVDMEGWGLVHGVNCLAWDTTDEMMLLVKEWLGKTSELRALGRAGARLMREHHTWDVRINELAALLEAVRGQV